jgi:hypothetical protein
MLASFQTNFQPLSIHPAVITLDLVIAIIAIAGMWKTNTKAGQYGWACLVPIYNIIVLLRIAGKPWWWIFLFLIPIVNLVIIIIVNIDVAKNFGKGAAFGIGLFLLGFIFFPILGFGDAQYQGFVPEDWRADDQTFNRNAY